MSQLPEPLRPFELAAPGRIVFGTGSAKALGSRRESSAAERCW